MQDDLQVPSLSIRMCGTLPVRHLAIHLVDVKYFRLLLYPSKHTEAQALPRAPSTHTLLSWSFAVSGMPLFFLQVPAPARFLHLYADGGAFGLAFTSFEAVWSFVGFFLAHYLQFLTHHCWTSRFLLYPRPYGDGLWPGLQGFRRLGVWHFAYEIKLRVQYIPVQRGQPLSLEPWLIRKPRTETLNPEA